MIIEGMHYNENCECEGCKRMSGKSKEIGGTSIAQALAEERERVRGYIENAIKYTNWSHSVGSHSDDRGGDSDIECTCNEDEAKYKTEAYRNVLSFLPNKTLTK